MIRRSARLLLPALLLAACEPSDAPLDAGGPSYLRARVSGAVVASHEGTGEFWAGGSEGLGQPPTFGINSFASGSDAEAVSLWSRRAGRPAPGSYELRPPGDASGRGSGFSAVYHHQAGTATESFVAESGTLRITASSPERVAGTFEFRGVRYCARDAATQQRSGSCTPERVEAGAPRIAVTGSFVATPARYDVELR